MAARLVVGTTVLLACLAYAGTAGAQTWVDDRTTPHGGETLAIDASGEAGWPFGSENLPAVADVRTVYGAIGDTHVWWRFYFASTSQPPPEITTYVFIDTDRSASTGGPAAAPEVDPALIDDPSNGGYEYFVATPADETTPVVWEWDGTTWVDAEVDPLRVEAEVGVDEDPVFLGSATRGYLQTRVEFGIAGLNASCNVDFYFRATSGDADPGDGDLVIGEEEVPCTPQDGNHDGVPDVLVPPDCTDDDDCPLDGICVDGECVIPVGCATDVHCDADEDCVDGICVARGGEDCLDDGDCDGLICDNGTCVACVSDAQCENGRCGPDGRCTNADAIPTSNGTAGSGPDYGLELDEGDEVRGGACKCQSPGQPPIGGAWLAVLTAATCTIGRRKSRRKTRR